MSAHPFRFAVVCGRPSSGAAWLDSARRVESLGFDLLFLPDGEQTPSPFPALAAAAAVTTTLRVAPWVLAAPLRTPTAVTREVTALQLVSGGRFELGLGTGRPDAAEEAARLGMPWGSGPERLAQLLATIEAVRAEDPGTPVIVAAAGPKALAAGGSAADTVALALAPTATVADAAAAADRVRTTSDPELAMSIWAVGGRPAAFLAARGVPAEALRDSALALHGDAAAMADQVRALRDATGVSLLSLTEDHAAAFAPVIALLHE